MPFRGSARIGIQSLSQEGSNLPEKSKLSGLPPEKWPALALQHLKRDHPAYSSFTEPQACMGIPRHS